jgi:hypothetical protein
MDDQLDNDLKNRIREVFDNFEDASADEGWLLLREKYPEGAKRRPIAWLWWSSAAAVLLLFIGLWFFQSTPIVKKQFTVNRKQLPHIVTPKKEEQNNKNETEARNNMDSTISGSRAEQLVKNNRTYSRSNKNKTAPVLQNEPLAANTHQPVHTFKNDRAEVAPKIVAPLASNNEKSLIAIQPVPGGKSPSDNLIAASPAKAADKVIAAPKNSNDSKVDSAKSLPVKLMAAAKPAGIDMKNEHPKNSSKTLFSDDSGQPVKMQEKGYKTVSFGVYAGSYFNYAKGSNNQVNIGAGITSDIRLSNRFKLSTGISIGQNRLGYGGSGQALNTTLNSPLAFGAFTPQSTLLDKVAAPTIKNSNANLVGLEVPINLKYVLNPKKDNTYVSIGLSSGTFINETYTYAYNYYPSLFSTNVTQSQNQSSHQSFNSFYFAKTLNFSFGTGYSFGGNKLIIEPFVKYPLQGLGSQQIKFGAGGVNLKFNLERQGKALR